MHVLLSSSLEPHCLLPTGYFAIHRAESKVTGTYLVDGRFEGDKEEPIGHASQPIADPASSHGSPVTRRDTKRMDHPRRHKTPRNVYSTVCTVSTTTKTLDSSLIVEGIHVTSL